MSEATDHWEVKTDKQARNRAEQIVKDALRVLMKGITFSPRDGDCPRLRAQIAVRYIANILGDLSDSYLLDPDLKAALWDVANGSEPELPEWLRRSWDDLEVSSGFADEPPDKVQ